jgi:hypothetical protein
MQPFEIILRAMFISLGLFFFAFAAWLAFGSIRTIATHDKFVAEVRECRATGSPNTRLQTYRCEVKYQSSMGRHSATIDNLILIYDPGDQVDIYVGTGKMYSVKAGGFLGLWAVPILLSIFGSIFFGYGVWPYKEGKKKRRTSRPPGSQPPISK